MPTFDQEGGYKPESGAFDKYETKSKGSMSLDLSSVPGAKDYQPGDEVMLEVKARVGQSVEGGMTDLEIIRVKAEDMDSSASAMRNHSEPEAPELTL